jgi:para-aminobenzoate synthetase/4-amino-4-deoxychorismate lyase
VAEVLSGIERFARENLCYAVGFVTYEAGAAFGLRVCADVEEGLPLAWFALFEGDAVRSLEPPAGVPLASSSYELGPLRPSIDRRQFDAAFARIRAHLADGDSYQANFTFRMEGPFAGDPERFFADLATAQRGAYSAFLRLGRYTICSASPELFFARTGTRILAKPMKGTARRGRTLAEDVAQRDGLRASDKQRAENVMVVDMVRNDLGRIGDIGSVHVPELFTVERYPNVWQMTSSVEATSHASLPEIFAALHPSASVTGAPKPRTMEILSALEGQPRGVYTGAIGVVAPGGDTRFSVAIRTAVVDHGAGQVRFGIGSGIVWDSDPADEYEECLLKGSVLGQRPVAFELLETMRWTPGEGFRLLDRHLLRLSESIDYFDFAPPKEDIRAALARSVATCHEVRRVRLLLSKDGDVHVEHTPLQARTTPLSVCLAEQAIDASDPFFFHKTTNRGAHERARRPGFDDVVLWNRNGEVTEATVANIVVDLDGVLTTPPVRCGLLPGTFRAELLASGALHEAIVTVEALRHASRSWLINSVHGWLQANLKEWGNGVME